VIAHLLKRLRRVVGDEHGDAAGAAVHEGGPDRLPQVGLAGHVVHGVVDEHRVERAAEPHRAHVALLVLAFGVETS